LHHWRLRFRQCSFHRIARVLRDAAVNVFRPLPLSQHASFPLGLRRKVGWVTQKSYSSELLPSARGIEVDSPFPLLTQFRRFPQLQVIDLDAALGTGANDDLMGEVARQAVVRAGGGVLCWPLGLSEHVRASVVQGMRSPHTPLRDILSTRETLHLLT